MPFLSDLIVGFLGLKALLRVEVEDEELPLGVTELTTVFVGSLTGAGVKFEIVTANTNLTIDDQGIATWKNVEGAAFTGANIDVNVTITHKYGTSTGTIKLEVKEKASK